MLGRIDERLVVAGVPGAKAGCVVGWVHVCPGAVSFCPLLVGGCDTVASDVAVFICSLLLDEGWVGDEDGVVCSSLSTSIRSSSSSLPAMGGNESAFRLASVSLSFCSVGDPSLLEVLFCSIGDSTLFDSGETSAGLGTVVEDCLGVLLRDSKVTSARDVLGLLRDCNNSVTLLLAPLIRRDRRVEGLAVVDAAVDLAAFAFNFDDDCCPAAMVVMLIVAVIDVLGGWMYVVDVICCVLFCDNRWSLFVCKSTGC